MDTLWALLLIGLAVFVGGIVLRRVPSSWLGIGAVIVVFGLGIPALVIDDNKESKAGGGGGAAAAAPSGGGSTSAGATGGTGKSGGGGGGGGTANAQGKLIFQQNCGTCHTLADAGTNGQVGPNLDEVKPNKQLVLSAIKNGGLGSGTMPAGIVSGKEAEDVADYVSSVAGK